MNGAIAWAHYWAGTNANDTLREYVAFEFSPDPADVDDVMTAIGLLETSWPAGATKQPTIARLATQAFALISKVSCVERAVNPAADVLASSRLCQLTNSHSLRRRSLFCVCDHFCL